MMTTEATYMNDDKDSNYHHVKFPSTYYEKREMSGQNQRGKTTKNKN